MDRFSHPKHIKWAKAVKARDGFVCQICSKKGVYLNSHHIYSFDIYKDKRYLVSNGITLCAYHHEMFHNIYGHGNNTEHQFSEFKYFCKLIEKIAKESADIIKE